MKRHSKGSGWLNIRELISSARVMPASPSNSSSEERLYIDIVAYGVLGFLDSEGRKHHSYSGPQRILRKMTSRAKPSERYPSHANVLIRTSFQNQNTLRRFA